MQAWIKEIAPNLYTYRAKFFTACSATVEMFWKAGLIAFVIGLLFGILLVITRKGGIRQNPLVYQATNLVINIFRSIPFIILLRQGRHSAPGLRYRALLFPPGRGCPLRRRRGKNRSRTQHGQRDLRADLPRVPA